MSRTFTVPILLPADPTVALEAATKQYVDTIASGGIGTVNAFTFNSATTAPPTGNQIRFNNATQASTTVMWCSQTTFDGLDISIGLSRITTGYQIYIQDFDDSSAWILFDVTANGTDLGSYWSIPVTYNGGPGIPTQKVAVQTITPAGHGLPPGGADGDVLTKTSASNYAAAWEVPTGGGGSASGTKLSALAALTGAGANASDIVEVVDVSDTTMAASGTNKKMTLAELGTFLGAGGGGAGVLDGVGPPADALGASGDMYADVENGTLYGPKGQGTVYDVLEYVSDDDLWGAWPDTPLTNRDIGVRITFAVAGQVKRVRYVAVDEGVTRYVRAWNDTTHVKIAEVANTPEWSDDTFRAEFAAPIPVAAGQTIVFTVGSTVTVDAYDGVYTLANTANMTFVEYRQSSANDTWPSTVVTAQSFAVAPEFETIPVWPLAVYTVPHVLTLTKNGVPALTLSPYDTDDGGDLRAIRLLKENGVDSVLDIWSSRFGGSSIDFWHDNAQIQLGTSGGTGSLVMREESGGSFVVRVELNTANDNPYFHLNSVYGQILLTTGAMPNMVISSGVTGESISLVTGTGIANIDINDSNGEYRVNGHKALTDPGATPTNTKFLRDDGTWQTVAGGSADGLGPDGNKGDVSVGGTGTTLTVNADAVTNTKLANMAAATIKGRTTGSAGDPLDLTATDFKTIVAYTAADVGAVPTSRTITTSNGIQVNGSTSANLSANVTFTLADDQIAYSKLANIANNTILGNNSGSLGDPIALGVSAVKTMLAITGTDIAVDSVTNTQLQPMPTLTIKGNATGSTAGPQDLSVYATQGMLRRPVVASTGTTLAPVLGTHENVMVTMSNAAVQTITLPSDATSNFPIGAETDYLWLGVGQPAFAAGASATINSESSWLKIRARYTAVTAKKIAANTWVLLGALAA